MIYCLNGKLLMKTTDEVVIDCCGVGYKVSIPTTVYAELGAAGTEATVYTYMNVKDDGVELYGFANEEQRECFAMLITVSGVGPRSALAILSLYTPSRVTLAIASGDYKAFTACAGIGPKLAQRLVLELKDKVKNLGGDAASYIAPAASGAAAETVAALVTLGFSHSEAASAVAKLPQELTTEQMVSEALKSLAGRR